MSYCDGQPIHVCNVGQHKHSALSDVQTAHPTVVVPPINDTQTNDVHDIPFSMQIHKTTGGLAFIKNLMIYAIGAGDGAGGDGDVCGCNGLFASRCLLKLWISTITPHNIFFLYHRDW